MQFELTLNFDYIDTVRLNILIRQTNVLSSISIMTLIGWWRFTGTHTENGVATVCNNETTPLRPDCLLGEFAKASDSRISHMITERRGQKGRLTGRPKGAPSFQPLV